MLVRMALWNDILAIVRVLLFSYSTLLYFTLHYSAYSTLAFELYSTLLWRTGRSWANLSTIFQFLRFREIVVGFWAELFDFCHFLEQRRT